MIDSEATSPESEHSQKPVHRSMWVSALSIVLLALMWVGFGYDAPTVCAQCTAFYQANGITFIGGQQSINTASLPNSNYNYYQYCTVFLPTTGVQTSPKSITWTTTLQTTLFRQTWICNYNGATNTYFPINCTWQSNITAFWSPPPQCSLTASPSGAVNPGDTVTLTATCTPSATGYQWTNASSTTSTSTINPTSTTTVSVQGSNASGAGNTASVTVTVNQPVVPVCSLSSSPGTINRGGSSTLTASCTPAATSYTWTNSGFASSAPSGSVSPTSTTTYSVVGNNAAGSSASASTTVTVNQPPTCSLTPSPSTINRGGSSTLTASCTPAATSYVWTNTGFSSSAPSGSVSPTTTATYSVVGQNAAGAGDSASATVTVNQPPTCTLTPSPSTINRGGSSTLTASCTPAATSYVWTNTGFGSSAPSGSVSPTTTDSYSVVGQNAAGDSAPASATVTVNQPPTCSLSALPTTINLGGSSTLTASCSPAATLYSWTNSGFASTASSGSVSPTSTVTYSVVGTNAAGDSTSASVTVTVNQPPTCTLSASPTTINRGESSTLTTTCTPAATSYSWTNAPFSTTTSSGSVSPTTTTTYSVQGSNASGTGSSTSATVTVNQPALPVCTLTATPALINLGETSDLATSCTPAATSYVWTNTTFASSASGGTVSPTATTNYSVVGRNGSGDSASAPATVTVRSLTEVTSGTRVNASPLSLNRATGKYSGTITVTNTGGAPLTGPLYVFFTLPPGVTLPSLATADGTPYIIIPGGLAAGASSSPVTLTFTNPTNARIAYTTRRYVVGN